MVPYNPTLKNLYKFGLEDKARDLDLNTQEIDFRCTMKEIVRKQRKL